MHHPKTDWQNQYIGSSHYGWTGQTWIGLDIVPFQMDWLDFSMSVVHCQIYIIPNHVPSVSQVCLPLQ